MVRNDDEHLLSSCQGKQGHTTRKAAERAVKNMRRHNAKGVIKIYHCSHCGLWHWGASLYEKKHKEKPIHLIAPHGSDNNQEE